MKTKTMNCKPFAANYTGRCFITNEPINIGDRVFYDVNNNLCLYKNYKKTTSKLPCTPENVGEVLKKYKMLNGVEFINVKDSQTAKNGVRVQFSQEHKVFSLEVLHMIQLHCTLNDWGCLVYSTNTNFLLYFYDNQQTLWK